MKKNVIAVLISVMVIIALASTGCIAQSDEDQAPKTYSYMFVQSADSGSFVPIEREENLYHLTLEGVSANTTYFSDRPERIVGQAPMQKFLEGMGFSESNPPNAALEVLESKESSDLVVVELFNPAYHAETNTLEYTASILKEPNHSYAVFNENHDRSIPKSFGANSLFIDDCPSRTVKCTKSDGTVCGQVSCCTCYSTFYCGFQDNCCTAQRCEGKCANVYGNECRHMEY